jgi:hypothetical protein
MMDVQNPRELAAALRLQRLKKLDRLLRRARRRGLFWRALQLIPLALPPIVLVWLGGKQPASNAAITMLLILVGLGTVLVAGRIDALLGVLEARGLLDDR